MTYFATAKANLTPSYQSVPKNSKMLRAHSAHSSGRVCIDITWKWGISLGQGAKMRNRSQ